MHALVELEAFEIRQGLTQPRIDVHGQSSGQAHEHDAGSLLARQFDQSMGHAINVAEGAFLRDAKKLAVSAVGPSVVAAAESAGIAAAFRHELHRAMSAHIDHRLHDSISATHDENFATAHAQRLVIAGVR